jgi:hypothetical protein
VPEKPRHIPLHPLLERQEVAVVTRTAQIFDARLREILVLRPDRRRHVDILDIGRSAQRLEERANEIIEAARPARSDIKNARYRGGIAAPFFPRATTA